MVSRMRCLVEFITWVSPIMFVLDVGDVSVVRLDFAFGIVWFSWLGSSLCSLEPESWRVLSEAVWNKL